MFTVFYADSKIDFSSSPRIGCDAVLSIGAGERVSLAKVLQKVENSKHLCVVSDDPETVYRQFTELFVPVNAAGGIVREAGGKYLLIKRRNRWDLPKGHMEEGETPRQCAMREVAEETGIENIEILSQIAETLHFYKLAGRWEMKRTWWFLMHSGQSEPVLIPQQEEGITEAIWVPFNTFRQNCAYSFASVSYLAQQLKEE